MKFLDQASVYVRSGNGGAGRFPSGARNSSSSAGRTAAMAAAAAMSWSKCVDGLNTLIDFRYQQHFKAKTGGHGMGKNRAGARGADAVLKVPAGTAGLRGGRRDADRRPDRGRPARACIARGGNGGFGNAHFKSSTNRAPRRANPGQEGEERTIWLRLKLIADAGLVGLPNAGKSTFLATVTAAKPKIADYPFTTLDPGLGVVAIDGREFVLADIPGPDRRRA